MISLRTRQKSASNTAGSRFAKFLLLLPLVLAAVLLFERVRGQFTLKVMAREMTTKGEALECKQLWPASSRLGLEFTNSLHGLTKSLPRSLLSYAGQITCFVPGPSGRWQRGSQQPSPVMYYGNSETQTWSNLESAVKSAEPALAALRQLMKNPPAALGYDAEAALRRDEFPNYIAFRIGAQSLHAAACCALHKHDLSGAIENLAALEGFVKLGENDPTLIGLMIRVAVLGMSIDVLWDALHSDGWSDESLAALQDICVRHRNILSQMPKAAEAERISHLYTVDWFRTHSYNESLSRYEPIVASFGVQPAAIERAVAPRAWRQWIFHPLWSFTWADQEKCFYLNDWQKNVAALRDASSHGSCQRLQSDLAAIRRAYRPPLCGWRFYRRVPLHDDFPGTDWHPLAPKECPYSSFERAWSTLLQNLTLNELTVAAIAIKRYELRHGGPPANLAQLSPDIVRDPPRDFMDGQPLRYRRGPGEAFVLYSIGSDFRDDGGKFSLASDAGSKQPNSPWAGTDWVWP